MSWTQSGEFLLNAGLCALLLAASTSQAQPPNPERACVAALASRPDLKPIAGKVWLAGARHQPFEFMASAETIDARDRKLVSVWLRERHKCFREGQAWRERHASTFELALAKWAYGRFLELGGLLYTGELSYGEYSQARAELSMDTVFAAAGLIRPGH